MNDRTVLQAGSAERPKGWKTFRAFQNKARVLYRGVSPADTVYRYMRLEQLRELFKTKNLVLKSPRMWIAADPYEGWWCDQLFGVDGPMNSTQAYASCWTFNFADEPFWRLYTCRCHGQPAPLPAVRIAVKVGSLLDVAKDAVQVKRGKAYVGHVSYAKSSRELIEFAASYRARAIAAKNSTAATALCMKRRAYQFENEVRFLWVGKGQPQEEIEVAVQPLKLIEAVMIGPTTDIEHQDQLRKLVRELGVPGNRIIQSLHYQPPGS